MQRRSIWNGTRSPIPRIHQELHARAADPVRAPCRVRHSAYLMPDDRPETRAEVRQRFQEIVRALEIPASRIFWAERSGRAETALSDTARLRVVWELHTEFYSYTTYHLVEDGRDEEALVPPFTFPAMPQLGVKLVDLDMAVLPGLELSGPLRAFLGDGPFYGGDVVDGEGRVWTSFRVDERGQGRYVVRTGSLPPGRLGRLIRRLVEIENYYHLILVPLEEYREQVVALRDLERRITERSEDIAALLAGRESDPGAEDRWLAYLTRDLAELIRLTERMRAPFSAAESYFAIFEERLRWLRERTGAGYQSLEEFLTARLGPAMRNYRNFMERAERLSGQLTTLSNMMRTRVSVNMERQNLQTLQAMNRRAELQLLLQRTVEGLGLVVFSYYATSLALYAFKALQTWVALPGGPVVWAVGSLPLWVLAGMGMTHHAKRLVGLHLQQTGAASPERERKLG